MTVSSTSTSPVQRPATLSPVAAGPNFAENRALWGPADALAVIVVHEKCVERDDIVDPAPEGGEDALDAVETGVGLGLGISGSDHLAILVPGHLSCQERAATGGFGHCVVHRTTVMRPCAWRVGVDASGHGDAFRLRRSPPNGSDMAVAAVPGEHGPRA